MNNYLRFRASRNFEKYLNDFLTTRESVGLPASRLSEQEWQQLNQELAKDGVVLVLSRHKNGNLYYFFKKLENTKIEKQEAFVDAKQDIKQKLTKILKEKYPNLPDVSIAAILNEPYIDSDRIYQKLRYKQDGKYNDVSYKEFEDAFIYALQSCENKDSLILYDRLNNWDSDKYKRDGIYAKRKNYWPDNKSILMDGGQFWTWFRSCGGYVNSPVRDEKNPRGFHISLNVRVTKELLEALDDILIEDGKKYIYAYKFPKTTEYDEIQTRHDPVTIYTNARNPELEQKIANAIKPFVRSNDGLIGEMLGDGLCIMPESSGGGEHVSVGQKISQDIEDFLSPYKDVLRR